MKYKNIIQVKVTEEQTEKIKKASEEMGLPMTSFIRFQVLKNIKGEEV